MSKFFTILFILTTSSAFTIQYANARYRNYDPGYPVEEHRMMTGYNAPGRIAVFNSWNLFLTGSYLYWQPREEGLALGLTTENPVVPIAGSRVINMNFKYRSGFKAGLGINFMHDFWDVYAEYTRLHQKTSVSSDSSNVPTGRLFPFWLAPQNAAQTLNGSSRWRLNFDQIDLELIRSYYVGSKLIFRFSFGGRLAFINQRFNARYLLSTVALDATSRNTSKSWGLGPKLGINTHWLFSYGLRIFGKVETSLLYTNYRLSTKQENPNPANLFQIDIKERIAYLRPNAGLGLGFGWGTYFGDNTFHIDLSASYDFITYWNQNMFRRFFNITNTGLSEHDRGDLYFHGATGTLRFDF